MSMINIKKRQEKQKIQLKRLFRQYGILFSILPSVKILERILEWICPIKAGIWLIEATASLIIAPISCLCLPWTAWWPSAYVSSRPGLRPWSSSKACWTSTAISSKLLNLVKAPFACTGAPCANGEHDSVQMQKHFVDCGWSRKVMGQLCGMSSYSSHKMETPCLATSWASGFASSLSRSLLLTAIYIGGQPIQLFESLAPTRGW